MFIALCGWGSGGGCTESGSLMGLVVGSRGRVCECLLPLVSNTKLASSLPVLFLKLVLCDLYPVTMETMFLLTYTILLVGPAFHGNRI